MFTPRSLAVAMAIFAATGSASCMDPVHSDEVAALGGEAKGVKAGKNHRPGQPCLTCHGGDGPGSPEWSVAGTIYAVRGKPDVLRDVTIVLTDATNDTKTLTSNEAGNFYIEAEDWSPTYPLRVELQGAGKAKAMKTVIGRNGGCASCHYGADNAPDHMPPVFMSDQ